MPKNLYKTGMEIRRSVLGDAHVERAEANKTAFDTPFQKFITENAWGTLWANDQLSKRERSLVTISLLASLGQMDELKMHVKATANTGASVDDVREVLQHVALYTGVPKANEAIKAAKSAYAEMGIEL